MDGVLGLDFDRWCPATAPWPTKADMRKFRDSAARLKNRVHEMIVQKKSKDDIAKMLKAEFSYADFHLDVSLDGLLVELR